MTKYKDSGLVPDNIFMSVRLQIAAQILPIFAIKSFPYKAADEALEMISCEVDNHIDRLLKERSRKLAEMELRYESNSPIGDCHV